MTANGAELLKAAVERAEDMDAARRRQIANQLAVINRLMPYQEFVREKYLNEFNEWLAAREQRDANAR